MQRWTEILHKKFYTKSCNKTVNDFNFGWHYTIIDFNMVDIIQQMVNTTFSGWLIFRSTEIEVNWAPSSEFVSSSIPSWQTLTAHAHLFRGARKLAFCLKVPLDSLLVWASSKGSGETARMRRLAWTFAARMGDKYQIRLTRSNNCLVIWLCVWHFM